MYPSFSLFGRVIPTYFLLSILGGFFAFLYTYKTNRRKTLGFIESVDFTHILIFAGLGAFVGGKLLYMITILPFMAQNWEFSTQSFTLFIQILLGGSVFYGGLYGTIVAVYLYCKKYTIPFPTVVAIFTPAIPLFHIFGRIGCFFAGCCWGIEVHWGYIFSHSIAAPNGIPLLPVQLIEACINGLLFIFLAWFVRKAKHTWFVLPLYLVLYSISRFTLEFFRGDKIRGVWLLSTSQWISLLTFSTIAFLYSTRWRRADK